MLVRPTQALETCAQRNSGTITDSCKLHMRPPHGGGIDQPYLSEAITQDSLMSARRFAAATMEPSRFVTFGAASY